MHINELRAKRTLAFGYRRAAELLEKEGQTEKANQAYEKSWEKLAEIAKNGPNEEIRCDGRLTTCTFAKTTRVNSERIFAGIQSIEPGSGNEREVHIDKGVEDGIVVGQQGEIWSLYAEEGVGHERHVMKLGAGEVLSVEPRSALVRVTLDKPEGDGMVREHDCFRLRARTLAHPEGSRLWPLVTYNIVIDDLQDNTIVGRDKCIRLSTTAQEEVELSVHGISHLALASPCAMRMRIAPVFVNGRKCRV